MYKPEIYNINTKSRLFCPTSKSHIIIYMHEYKIDRLAPPMYQSNNIKHDDFLRNEYTHESCRFLL